MDRNMSMPATVEQVDAILPFTSTSWTFYVAFCSLNSFFWAVFFPLLILLLVVECLCVYQLLFEGFFSHFSCFNIKNLKLVGGDTSKVCIFWTFTWKGRFSFSCFYGFKLFQLFLFLFCHIFLLPKKLTFFFCLLV